jgi:hypothetical protein
MSSDCVLHALCVDDVPIDLRIVRLDSQGGSAGASSVLSKHSLTRSSPRPS